MRLVADIGGTNTRIAFVPPGSTTPEGARSFRNAGFDGFEDVISEFLFHEVAQIGELIVAMAGPVAGNCGRLTNLDWVIDGQTLSQRFGGIAVRVINDLTALGHAALKLTPHQLVPVVENPVHGSLQRQALVVGIGTGFNVSPTVEAVGHILCPAVEAGHTSLYASIEAELDRLKPGLAQNFPTVEALFSGRGRRNFLSLLTGETVESATPYIANHGKTENAPFDAALDYYATLIGMLLAELKIAYLPTSGIFLAGGVARSSLTGERSHLCSEAAMRENTCIQISPPVWLIDDDAAALTGCASIEVLAHPA
ncbi:glucokinase [Amaricoccus tamworthensis]|uniref:glucokinase n=1 Tax=Amaricoccus tamworthensis TaxID=57002 RepID=UPI003C79D10B